MSVRCESPCPRLASPRSPCPRPALRAATLASHGEDVFMTPVLKCSGKLGESACSTACHSSTFTDISLPSPVGNERVLIAPLASRGAFWNDVKPRHLLHYALGCDYEAWDDRFVSCISNTSSSMDWEEVPVTPRARTDQGPPGAPRKPKPTPLHQALGCGDVHTVRRLLEAEPDLARERFWDFDAETPLCCAVRSGCPQTVALLLQSGAAVGDATAHGETPLSVLLSKHVCERIGDVARASIHRLLVDAGAEAGKLGTTPESPALAVPEVARNLHLSGAFGTCETAWAIQEVPPLPSATYQAYTMSDMCALVPVGKHSA